MNTKAFLKPSVITALVAGLGLIPAPPSFATFPGANGMIAFTSDRDGNFEIYVMNPDGSGQTNLTNDPDYDSSPVWSPDGTKIAFTSNRSGNFDIYVMNAEGTDLTNLTSASAAHESDPAWSFDGAKIVFRRTPSDGTANLWVMNADGTAETQLTNNTTHFPSAFHPDWSPDGAKIAFVQSLSNSRTEIYLVNPDSSNLAQITYNGINSMSPSWSPDSTQIVFERGPAGGADIWVMNPDGSDQINLTNNLGQINVSPRWSPDGKQIVFESYRGGGRYQIYVMNSDGTGPINLSNNSHNDYYPDWQPQQQVIPISIDIKPGSFPNSINSRSKGVIPVAILTTSAFDATTVDALSVEFGPAGATESHGRSHIEDVDGDGDLDLVLHFRTQDTGIQCEDTSASLSGETISGAAIEGADSIRTVGCK